MPVNFTIYPSSSSVFGKDGDSGVQGPEGPAGPAGPAGATGPIGPSTVVPGRFVFDGTIRGQKLPQSAANNVSSNIYPSGNSPPTPAAMNADTSMSTAYQLYYNIDTGEVFFYYNTAALFPVSS